MKGKKVIVLIVSEFLDGSCDCFILRSATAWQTSLTFRRLSRVPNVVLKPLNKITLLSGYLFHFFVYFLNTWKTIVSLVFAHVLE